jgi:hypothetical protein
MTIGHRLSSFTVGILVAACGEQPMEPSAPDPGSAPLLATQASVPDLSGIWLWRERVSFSVSQFAATVFFGIEPEGPITHFDCMETGTMDLTQSGASFSGTAAQDSECRTRRSGVQPADLSTDPHHRRGEDHRPQHALPVRRR